jgi:hypothetical protein
MLLNFCFFCAVAHNFRSQRQLINTGGARQKLNANGASGGDGHASIASSLRSRIDSSDGWGDSSDGWGDDGSRLAPAGEYNVL